MSRLIDADVAYELFSPFSSAFTDPEVMSAYLQTLQLISNATGTDAVNVVRCKECKYWIGHIADDDGFDGEDECRWRDSEAPNADDYCSYGERKESEYSTSERI